MFMVLFRFEAGLQNKVRKRSRKDNATARTCV